MKGNSQTLLKKYCLEGSILGLKYFYLYPDRVSRCYWTATMVCCVVVSWLLSSLLYQRFREMPTWITIENQFEPIENLPYPAITICSPNQITISAMTILKRNLVNGNLSTDLRQLIQQFMGLGLSIKKFHLEELEKLQNVFELNRYTAINVMSMLPQRCDDFLRRCIFQNKFYPCADLFEPILTRNGMCCIFNSIYYFKDNKRNQPLRILDLLLYCTEKCLIPPSSYSSVSLNTTLVSSSHKNERKTNFVEHKVTSVGRTYGLSVLMDYNPQDAMDNTIVNAGATKVLITDWPEFPGHDKLSLIHPGAEAFHRISFTYTYCSDEVQSLPVSSRKCYFADEYPLPHFKEYRNTDCDLSCLINEVEKQCQCTPVFVPSVSQHSACNFTILRCLKKVRVHMSKLYESGQCTCLRNCESRHYDSEVIIGNLKGMEHLMDNPYSDLVINKSTNLMHFYFPKYTYVKQKQETVISLTVSLSNLGGVFGLCLGYSFISVFEIWFYIYSAIKNRVRRYLKQKRRRRVGYKN